MSHRQAERETLITLMTKYGENCEAMELCVVIVKEETI